MSCLLDIRLLDTLDLKVKKLRLDFDDDTHHEVHITKGDTTKEVLQKLYFWIEDIAKYKKENIS